MPEIKIDRDTREHLLEVMSPAAWNLLAQFFDTGAVKTTFARDSVEAEDFLKSLMHNEQFQAALGAQMKERGKTANYVPPPRPKVKRGGKKKSPVRKKRQTKKR